MSNASLSDEHRAPDCPCERRGETVETDEAARAELARRLRVLAPSCAYKVLWIAAALHMSERQLRRLVRASFGVAPNRWLRQQRMRNVLELLLAAESVKEVAITLGYQGMSQFSRDFKQQFGCTPSSVLRQPAQLRVLASRLSIRNDRF